MRRGPIDRGIVELGVPERPLIEIRTGRGVCGAFDHLYPSALQGLTRLRLGQPGHFAPVAVDAEEALLSSIQGPSSVRRSIVRVQAAEISAGAADALTAPSNQDER